MTHATVWYASCSAGETKELHRVVQTAKCITGMESRRLTVSAKTTLPRYSQFEPLPSGKQFIVSI